MSLEDAASLVLSSDFDFTITQPVMSDDEFQKIVTDRLEEQRDLIIQQEEMLKKLSQQVRGQ